MIHVAHTKSGNGGLGGFGGNEAGNTQCFSEKNLAILQEYMYDLEIRAGQNLFNEGDKADKLYFLKSGSVRLVKTSDEGKSFVLHLYRPGDFIEQLEISGDALHTYRAEVITDSKFGVIPQGELEMLLWQHGDLAIEFIKWMGTMKRITETKFRDLILFGKPGALCSTLIRLGNTFGEKTNAGIRINKKLTHTDLADMIGATRESVNRMLGNLKKKKAVSVENGYYIIRDIEYLRDICHCEDCPLHICRI